MPDTTYTARGHAESPVRTRVEAGSHTLTVDVPPSSGGDDAAPSPIEYVLAGLVGCLNVTGHLVADEMDLAIDDLDIEVSGPYNPAKLTGKPTDDRAGLKAVTVILTAEADADEATLERWREAVEARCPVSDIVGNATPMTVEARAQAPTGA